MKAKMKLSLLFIFLGLGCLLFLCRLHAQKPVMVLYYYPDGSQELNLKPNLGLTHLIFAFADLNKGNLELHSAQDSALLRNIGLIKNKAGNHFRAMIAMGGWGGCFFCSSTFSNKDSVRLFASRTKQFLSFFNLDGIDLDWEYPAMSSMPGIAFNQADKEHLTYLIKVLRDTLGWQKDISIAAASSSNYMDRSVDWLKVTGLLNRINLMTYDFVNGDDKKTGHLTSLYSTSGQQLSCDDAVRRLEARGVPADKIVLGATLYDRVWKLEDSSLSPLYAPGVPQPAVKYKDIKQYEGDGGRFYFDSKAQADYYYNPKSGYFITGDTPHTALLKVDYMKSHHLQGIMFWELSGDLPENGILDAVSYALKSNTNMLSPK